MHAGATEGWERIAAAVSEADLDLDGVINRLLAFINHTGWAKTSPATSPHGPRARPATRTSPDERLDCRSPAREVHATQLPPSARFPPHLAIPS